MKIGIAYDLKPKLQPAAGAPDDLYEEFDSQETVEAIAAALRMHSHQTVLLAGGREFLDRVRYDPPDLVWNIAEGIGGRSREAHIPAICEFLGIPYTHSDPLTLAATLDKAVAKRLVASFGVATPEFVVIRREEEIGGIKFPAPPLFVKPLDEGSSKGIRNDSICRRIMEAEERVRWLINTYGRPVLVEQFIPGREITVGVIGNVVESVGTPDTAEVLGILEVIPRGGNNPEFIYSLEVKRDFLNRVEYVTPPQAPKPHLKRIEEAALNVFRALECRDVARIDFRLSETGVPFFIEANPLPGLSPATGDLPILARLLGISYTELIGKILFAAVRRLGLRSEIPVSVS